MKEKLEQNLPTAAANVTDYGNMFLEPGAGLQIGGKPCST
jgi:hypothetical protein